MEEIGKRLDAEEFDNENFKVKIALVKDGKMLKACDLETNNENLARMTYAEVLKTTHVHSHIPQSLEVEYVDVGIKELDNEE